MPVQTGTQCAGRGSSTTDRGASQVSTAWPLPKHRRGEGRSLPAVTYSAGKGASAAAPLVHLRHAHLPWTACGEYLVAHVSTTSFRDDGVTCPGCRAHMKRWMVAHYTPDESLIAGPGIAACGAGPLATATGIHHLVDCPDCLRWLEERGGRG